MKIDQLFKAFADETRLRILNILSQGDLCVQNISQALKISQPKTSRHLAMLRYAGLVDCKRKGLYVRYFLAKPQDKFHQILLDHIKKGYLKVIPIMREDLERLKAVDRSKCR